MTGRRDRGAGILGTSVGFLVFLLLLLAAVQILFNLYATSMVTTAALDAARSVAGQGAAGDRCGAVAQAEAGMRDTLGGYGAHDRTVLTWTCDDPDVVRVHIRATHPSVLPRRLVGLLSLGSMDRTIEIRAEEAR